MKAIGKRKSYVRPLVLGTAIFAVVIMHFAVSQFLSSESEKDSSVTELISKQPAITVEPDYKIEKIETKNLPEPEKVVFTKVEPKSAPKQEAVKQTVIKKKEIQRESRAERLRRAEKILTGV